MIKIALIGAGSVVFSRNLTGDILSFPEFKNATFTYMDIDNDRLQVGAALCRKVAKSLGANPKIGATLDRQEALRGADFVINMVQIGGFDSTLVDFEIPRKYGLNFTIADTTGPGGLFRALRTFPMLKGLATDMARICPRAILLNYSNPMSMNMQTITRTSPIRAVGLCHSVQGTLNQLMGYINEDPTKVEFICAGINHMAFYTRLLKDGVDLYPRLFEAMKLPDVYKTNKVRFEMMKVLGHFVTESSEHNAEYSPYFIPRGPESIAKYDVPLDEYLRRCDGIVDEFERMQKLAQNDDAMDHHRSHEYGSTIIHSVVTGTPSVVYGNMPNNGAIAGLPATAIAEAPTLVDRAGLQLTTVGELPPQLVAYMNPHIAQHELFIRAALEGRRDHVYQAAMFDPLTAATLSIDQIVAMCDELIAAHGFENDGGFLPALDTKKTLVAGSGKAFPSVRAKDLRASWDKAQSDADALYVSQWHAIGPFKGPTPGKISLSVTTAFEDDYTKRGDGMVDLKQTYRIGEKTHKWVPCTAGRAGKVDLVAALGAEEWCIGYAYTEVETVQGRETVLGIGSDDGVKVWLNGKLIHTAEQPRGYTPSSDTVSVYLKPGVNRILMKVDNYVAGWACGLRVPPANF